VASILTHLKPKERRMKKSAIFSTLLLIFLAASTTSLAQEGCEFDIIGTWKSTTTADAVVYRFTPDGVVTVLSGQGSEPQEIARATYELDDPKAPKSIALTVTDKNRVFLYGKSSIKISKFADVSLTCEMPGVGVAQWIKLDPSRYFIVLAARQGEFYDRSGPAFPILIKIAGGESQVDAVGIYSENGKAEFGPVPPEVYKDFMREPQRDSEVMLRLEINSAQYERGLKVVRTWARRARENALLYPFVTSLNNVLLVKAVTESLNQCSDEIKLYRLSYLQPEDWIAEKYSPPFIPFAVFKEMRRLNESLHVRDDKFQQASVAVRLRPGR
jgi:hypothetical protein